MSNRADNMRGQSIFEYFVLSIIVVSIALLFLKSNNYIQIKGAAEGVFKQAVSDITK